MHAWVVSRVEAREKGRELSLLGVRIRHNPDPGFQSRDLRSQLLVIGPCDHDDVGDPASKESGTELGRETGSAGPNWEQSLGLPHATRLSRGENHPRNHAWILTRPNLHAFLDFHDGTPYTGRVFKLRVCWRLQHSGFISEVDEG